MALEHLSAHDRKLVVLLSGVTFSIFMVGLIGGLLRFSNVSDAKQDQWQQSTMPELPDTLSEFNSVSTKPHWYMAPGTASALANEAAKKAIEGAPEAFKLLGIVETAGKKHALFLASDAASKGSRKVSQLSEGDVLIGDWKIKSMTSSKVTLVVEQEGEEKQTKEIELYSIKKP